jgi:hypothetical protein
MGCMLPNYFSNVKNRDAKKKHDIEGGISPHTMCPHTLKKRSKPLVKSFRKKKIIKIHTPYLKSHWKKHVVIEAKQR